MTVAAPGDPIDDYVFGHFKDAATNVIPDRVAACHLLRRFNRDRAFELIHCAWGESMNARLTRPEQTVLGYDVAVITGDYWSIVDDFSTSDWASSFKSKLNQSALFQSIASAETYLDLYRANDEPDADMPLDVIRVSSVAVSDQLRSTAET